MERKVMCKNVGVCSQANKIQIITDDDAELKCPECGEPVELVKDEPQPEALKGNKTKMFACIGGALVIVAGAALGLMQCGGSEAPKVPAAVAADTTKASAPAEPSTTVKTDTVVVRDTIVKNNTTTISEKTSTKTVVNTTTPAKSSAPKAAASSGSGTLRLSYGKYTGDIKGGYPEGMGRLTYSTGRVINKHDSKSRRADAGDYVIGEFLHGYFIQGKHYDASGNLIETLMIGTPATSDYESK